jgi:hypothetical protein
VLGSCWVDTTSRSAASRKRKKKKPPNSIGGEGKMGGYELESDGGKLNRQPRRMVALLVDQRRLTQCYGQHELVAWTKDGRADRN